MISSRDNSNIAEHIFARLFRLTADGEHVPDLAHTLEISDDGTEYVYTLREGLTCHDGEPLTAEDVAYTFNRIADPANRFTGNIPGFVYTSIGFQGAEALDDLRVQINLARKNPIAFGLLTEVDVHCEDSYEQMTLDEAAANPIGSGSYRLASWTRGSEVVLEKVQDPGTFQRIVWRIIPEASTRTAELVAGNVDIVTNVVPEQVDAINGSGRAEVQVVSGTRRMYVDSTCRTSIDRCRVGTPFRIRACEGPSSTRSTCPRSARSSWAPTASGPPGSSIHRTATPLSHPIRTILRPRNGCSTRPAGREGRTAPGSRSACKRARVDT